jgi:hypothetical protein
VSVEEVLTKNLSEESLDVPKSSCFKSALFLYLIFANSVRYLTVVSFLAERLTTIWVKHNIKPEKIFEIDYEFSDNLKPVNKITPSN